MCITRCSMFVGVTLIPTAALSMLANTLLLFPDLQTHYLLEGHVTREATWCPGLWASGLLVLFTARGFITSCQTTGCCGFRMEMLCQVVYSCIGMAAGGFCFLAGGSGLVDGPLCLHNSTEGLQWGRPLKLESTREKIYIYDQTRWPTSCEEPKGVVLWNVVLFSILMGASGIQVLLCAAHTLNALLGMMCGRGFGKNKVGPA